jgi:transposase
MAEIKIELDVPPGIRVVNYERHGEAHAFEVSWDLPGEHCCPKCRRREETRPEYVNQAHAIRDLEVWGQPSFFVYQPAFHRCGYCNHRRYLTPPQPFKREHVKYTFRFEQQVLRMLIGSTEEEVARRLGISAEMVATIVHHQLQDENPIASSTPITDVGLDEISLKKRHKLYATILWDLSDAAHPRVLAIASGRDEAAAKKCLERLSPEQREHVRTHRTDMSPAFTAACQAMLPKSEQVIDRFHVAQRLGEVVDDVRKKNAAFQTKLDSGGAEEVSLADVVVSQPPQFAR